MTKTRLPQDVEALELRFAARLAAGLTERAAATPHDITERLRFAREKAVAHARESRRAGAAAVVLSSGRGGAALGGPPAWWQRVASVLPLLVLAAGLLLINERVAQEQVQAAAEIDAVLLADDLPPEAYTDPGFAEFLKTPQP
jgi:Protein of unknown function (DUF3619)